MRINLHALARISLIILVYILIYYAFVGINLKTFEGDSINYHIPIAKAYLAGTIGNPLEIKGVPFLKYSPGSSEGILAILMFFKIPWNIYNIFAAISLLIVSFFVGIIFKLGKDLALIFAASVTSLHTIVRWLNTQVIDIWLLVFFLLSIYFLAKPEKTTKYFLFLGISLGMLFGTKYTGPLFSLVLIIFYFKDLLKNLNVKNFFAFLIPFSILGLSWYLRNYLVAGNPIYPQPFLFFKSAYFPILAIGVWKAALILPNGIYKFFSAFLSEYTVWALAILLPISLLIKNIRKDKEFDNLLKLSLIGLINFLIFCFLPSDKYYDIMVSVFRYSYSAFVPLILGVFILMKNYKKAELIAVIALINLLIIPDIQYHPKMLILFIPVALIIYFYQDLKIKFLHK